MSRMSKWPTKKYWYRYHNHVLPIWPFSAQFSENDVTRGISGVVAPWCSGYHYCTTSCPEAWTQVLCKFKSCSRHVGDLRWWESLTMVPAGNTAKRLSSVNHPPKIIHQLHQNVKVKNVYPCRYLLQPVLSLTNFDRFTTFARSLSPFYLNCDRMES